MSSNDNKAKEVHTLIEKAADARLSDDAMRWSQAANNAANAMCALKAVIRND
jgi:hypothetical protein